MFIFLRCEIDGTNDQGRTALHLACLSNHPDTVQVLLFHRALDSLIDSEGHTALHYAVVNKSVAAVGALCQLSEMTHAPDSERRTPLIIAAEGGQERIVKTLLKNRSVVKMVDSVELNGRSGEYKIHSFVIIIHIVTDIHFDRVWFMCRIK